MSKINRILTESISKSLLYDLEDLVDRLSESSDRKEQQLATDISILLRDSTSKTEEWLRRRITNLEETFSNSNNKNSWRLASLLSEILENN